jgi:hypothetical protein
MLIGYQPANEHSPVDWVWEDSSKWVDVGEMDINAINVQGMVFEGPDQYSVEHRLDGTVVVHVWHSDPSSWPVGQRWARVVTLRPLAPDADPRYGGAINTGITQTIYAEEDIAPILRAAYQGNASIEVLDWSEFDPGLPPNPKPGIWLSDASYLAHQEKRTLRGWREWTEGLDPSEYEDGRLKDQRAQGRYSKPLGSRTYYHNGDDAVPSAVHNADYENALATSATGATDQTAAVGPNGSLTHLGSTAANEPGTGSWPTTGVYRWQVDIKSIGADLTCGLMTQGNKDGHFARVDSALASDLESFVQDQGAFSSPGLEMASITDPAWTSGSAGDRFEVLLASYRTTGHGTQNLTLELGETDDFADGPWPEAVAVSNAIFFGTNF